MPAKLAIFIAGDRLSVLLGRLRRLGLSFMEAKTLQKVSTSLSKQLIFARGYQAGFDKAIEIVAEWGLRMSNPHARDEIRYIVERLQAVRSQMNPDVNERILTLRARKYVI